MTRFPSVTAKEMASVLKRAGFVEHHQKGSHLWLYHTAQKRMVCVPMHCADLPRGTMKAIIKQSGLTEETLREFL
ncbi:type II toxin-antitoxin system HicA family toxin [Candidatus Sumerlaeota bacterium]|nr:type II toxin-antitoxin system HicA family toxin [Candidatus Sumerlaeota bacterium]MBI3736042.1 type II toxin-antitoxin system HicA family toxin [Candidatus Sumerlaeota bacterium]